MKHNYNVLFSYHYFKNTDIGEQRARLTDVENVKVFLDSGAWSAFTQGVDIDIDKYVEYVDRNKHDLDIYANLDDMLSAKNSYDNLKYLESNGLKPLPVFHTGEDFKFLKEYAANYEYVCIGRIIPFTNRPKIIVPWMKKCMDILKNNKVHAFGVTNYNLIKMFPFHSFDSSSWTGAYRYGRLQLFDKMIKDFRCVQTSNTVELQSNIDLLNQNGYKVFNFPLDVRKKCHLKVGAISAVSYKRFENCLNDLGKDLNFYYAAVVGDVVKLNLGFNYLEQHAYAN